MQPQTQEPAQTPQTSAPQPQASMPYMQSRVQYFGTTIFSNGGIGLLEWSADGRIRLFAIDPETKQSKGVEFDCLPTEITKVTASVSNLNLKVNGKTFNLDFSSSAVPWLMAGGAVGLYMANKKQQESGIQWWIENLKTHGVNVANYTMGKIFLIAGGITLGLIVLLFIVMVIAGVASS